METAINKTLLTIINGSSSVLQRSATVFRQLDAGQVPMHNVGFCCLEEQEKAADSSHKLYPPEFTITAVGKEEDLFDLTSAAEQKVLDLLPAKHIVYVTARGWDFTPIEDKPGTFFGQNYVSALTIKP